VDDPVGDRGDLCRNRCERLDSLRRLVLGDERELEARRARVDD
jgi:hypothetical protein